MKLSLDLLESVKKLSRLEIQSVDLVKNSLKLIEAYNNSYIFISVMGEKLLDDAEKIDTKRKNGEDLPLLSGTLVSLKDNFALKGQRMTAGSLMLDNFIPPYNSTISSRLHQSNICIVGKTNMDEFGMGSSGITSRYGTTINPWKSEDTRSNQITCGGSSGGSAASVSSGICSASIGSDTGGSVRQPASFTEESSLSPTLSLPAQPTHHVTIPSFPTASGTVGFKPTYGALSRHGLVAYCSSMDTPGIIARSVTDVALLYDTLIGHDARDPQSVALPYLHVLPTLLDIPPPESIAKKAPAAGRASVRWTQTETVNYIENISTAVNLPTSLKGMRVGIAREFMVQELHPDIRIAWEDSVAFLVDAGAVVHHVSLPSFHLSLPCYYTLACAEAASNLARYDGIRYGYRSTSTWSTTPPPPHPDDPTAPPLRPPIAPPGASSSVKNLLEEVSRTRAEGFGTEVIKRVLLGDYVLSQSAYHDYYARACQTRRRITHELDVCLQSVDVLILPTVPLLPFRLDCIPDSAGMLLNDVMTVTANLAGIPAISVPVSVSSRSPENDLGPVPIGVQLWAGRLQEVTLLKAALALEQRAKFHQRCGG